MRTMSAKDAKNRFGEILLDAQRDGVVIEKNGKPVAVVLSYEEHQAIERMKLERLKAMIAEGIADIEAGRVLELDDALIDELCSDQPSRFDR